MISETLGDIKARRLGKSYMKEASKFDGHTSHHLLKRLEVHAPGLRLPKRMDGW